VAVADVGPERPELAAAVGGGVALAEVEDPVAEQRLAEPKAVEVGLPAVG
jgi:hypothetical protein